jgi:hypothetical protein
MTIRWSEQIAIRRLGRKFKDVLGIILLRERFPTLWIQRTKILSLPSRSQKIQAFLQTIRHVLRYVSKIDLGLIVKEPQTDDLSGDTGRSETTLEVATQNDGNNTGDSVSTVDGNSTPSTPRSTPAKPSVFKKTIQKVNLNKDFLKNLIPANNGSQPASTTPRALASEKRIHSVCTPI